MDNLNERQGPERQGDGSGDISKWNYVPIVSMLGIAAFRWIWSKQFQYKIKETKVEIYQALDSQNQKLEEERHHMRLEIKNEISRQFQKVLEMEKEQEKRASVALNDVKSKLMDRQDIFCSNLMFLRPQTRMEKENDLFNTAKEPRLAHLEMEDDLNDIFKNDRSCAEYFNTDKRKNGSLMWLYLRYWKLQLTLQTHQRAEAAIFGTQTKE